MLYVLVIINTLIFIFLGLLHFYWAAGGQWAAAGVVPEMEDGGKPFEPGPIPTIIVGFGLLSLGAVMLANLGWLDDYFQNKYIDIATLIVAIIFLMRAAGDLKYAGWFKRVKGTLFAERDTKYYTPLCTIIGFISLVIYFM